MRKTTRIAAGHWGFVVVMGLATIVGASEPSLYNGMFSEGFDRDTGIANGWSAFSTGGVTQYWAAWGGAQGVHLTGDGTGSPNIQGGIEQELNGLDVNGRYRIGVAVYRHAMGFADDPNAPAFFVSVNDLSWSDTSESPLVSVHEHDREGSLRTIYYTPPFKAESTQATLWLGIRDSGQTGVRASCAIDAAAIMRVDIAGAVEKTKWDDNYIWGKISLYDPDRKKGIAYVPSTSFTFENYKLPVTWDPPARTDPNGVITFRMAPPSSSVRIKIDDILIGSISR